jgi:hypothetical protein
VNDNPFTDPELTVTADRVRSVLQTGGMRPEFSQWLRARLVAEAATRVAAAPQAAPAPARPHRVNVPDLAPDPFPVPVPAPVGGAEPGQVVPLRRTQRDGRGRRIAAWVASATTAVAATAAVVVGLVPSLLQPGDVLVQASSVLTGVVSADPATPIRLTFNQALDHASTEAGLRLSPATSVRTSWDGDTLVISPVHGLAANSAYVLTVDAATARTASGKTLAADLQLGFGTAPGAADGTGTAASTGDPANLQRVVMTSASDESEAVVTRAESLLVTGARTPAGNSLVRMQERGDGERTLGAATDAICVSRSGRSVAFLGKTATGSGIVFATAEGAPQRTVEVKVDRGSPLGWIDDEEVTFVSGGKIMAANRQGRVRVLWSQPVDASRQSLVVAPGGRYVYLGSGSTGLVIDLVAGTSHTINGLAISPAFTADGAGIVWVDAIGPAVRVHHGPSNGGPATSAVLPVSSTDRIGDLAVSPDGTRFVYSVSGIGHSELRLAALPSGVTLATSAKGAGSSPNFSPTGQFFTVLSGGAGSHRIEMVKISKATGGEAAGKLAAARAVAEAFALAQVAADTGAQSWLARSGLTLPQVPSLTRAALLWAVPADDGTVTARVRLTSDPQPDSRHARAYAVQGEEMLTISPAGSAASGAGIMPKVTAVEAGPFAPAPSGPQVLRVMVNSAGEVGVTFDSDLDAASAQTGVRLTAADGAALSGAARYDSATRTVWVSPGGAPKGALVRISVAGVRDVRSTSAISSGPLEARLG